MRPDAVLDPTRISPPATANLRTDARIPRVSWAPPRWTAMAALSKVSAATVATDPTMNRNAMSGSRPMTARLFPMNGDRPIVPAASTAAATPEMTMAVDRTGRWVARSMPPISAMRNVEMPRMPSVDNNRAVDEAANASPTWGAPK